LSLKHDPVDRPASPQSFSWRAIQIEEDTLSSNEIYQELLHTRDAARMLGVSAAWLERKRWEGNPPPYVKVGGPNGRAVRYRQSDLLNYIEQNTVQFPLPTQVADQRESRRNN
jgi:predicted DNA-binding transcriptional regulator AlpA